MAKIPKRAMNGWIQHLSRVQALQSCQNFDEWIDYLSDDSNIQQMNYFGEIKKALLQKYHLKDIHPSNLALDIFIFEALKTEHPNNFEHKIDDLLSETSLDGLSSVIFPLHSFGLADIGILNVLQRNFSLKMGEAVLFPQTNSYERTKQNITRLAQEIGHTNINWDSLDHYKRSRGLKWLEYNPIMFLTFRFSQIDRFENLAIIIERIRLATIKMYVSWAITISKKKSNFSTRNINNWETLDISHFLTITTGREPHINCIPLFSRSLLVFEDTNMNIDLTIQIGHSRGWRAGAIKAIDDIFENHIQYENTGEKKYKIYERLWTALDYFRRSIKSTNMSDSTVLLQTAFEIVFLDTRNMNKKEEILKRTWLMTKGKSNNRKSEILSKMESLINARNSFIHAGKRVSDEDVDFRFLYQLFCQVLVYYTDRIFLSKELLEDRLSDYYKTCI